MTEKKPINVEAQRIARIMDEYASKLGILSLLSAEFFIEVRKKSEEELTNAFGKEVGQLLFIEANCEDKFPQVNQKMS